MACILYIFQPLVVRHRPDQAYAIPVVAPASPRGTTVTWMLACLLVMELNVILVYLDQVLANCWILEAMEGDARRWLVRKSGEAWKDAPDDRHL
jgi:hypothetical protein